MVRASRKRMLRLAIFGDRRKGHVAEAIAEFADFVKGKSQDGSQLRDR